MADIASPSSRPVYGTVRFWLFGLCNGALLEAVLDEGLRHLWPLMLLLYVVSVMILIPNGKRSARASDTGEPADSPGQRTFGDLGVLCGIGAGICLFWLALGADGRVPWFGLTLFVLGSLGLLVLYAVPFAVRIDSTTSLRNLLFAASVFGIAVSSGIVAEDWWPRFHDILTASGFFGFFVGGSVVASGDTPWKKAAYMGYGLAFAGAGFGALPLAELILKGRAILWASLALPVVAGAVTAFLTYAVIRSCPAGPKPIEGS